MRTILFITVNQLFLTVFCTYSIKTTLQNHQDIVPHYTEPTDQSKTNRTIIVEASWDETFRNQSQVIVQAGESTLFICSIWTLASDNDHDSESGIYKTEQSVFLFCPMSVAYCAQDCLVVDSTWPLQCTRQFRIVSDPDILLTVSSKNLQVNKEWRLQEVIYKLDIATITSAGLWGCTYGGYQSNSLELIVRDRPALVSLTTSPSQAVEIGTNVKLTCEAAPSPKAPWYTFVWRRLGTQMPPAHSTLRISDTVSVLTLLSVQPADDGIYTCHIYHSQSNLLNEEIWDKNETVESGTINLVNKFRLRKDPAVRSLHLEVFHPPISLNITVQPPGPHRVRTNVTFTCHIHGGKPKPQIYFYRINAPLDNENISLIQSNSFTSKHILENVTRTAGSTELKWQLTEVDNIASFGCAASSPVIKNQMFSLFIKVKIIFSPQEPILSSVPHGPVSENRTKVFTCQSSKGSNPRAIIIWELTPAMEYLSTMSKRNYVNYNRSSEKKTIIQPGMNSDFEYVMSDTYSNVKHDPNNGGIIAHSEVRLIGRPWYNGARVTCHLIWNDKGNYSIKEIALTIDNQNTHHKMAYLLTEVFFCPSAVNLNAIPQTGIQEKFGEQLLECTATSSHPPALISWFRHNSSSSAQNVFSEDAVIGSSLIKIDAHSQANLLITTETFPGIYGGKRVVSRLRLSNISRNSDGMLLTCLVKHIEWTESISRTHQLMVLYPPTLKVTVTPQTLEDRLKSNRITLICTAEGGQPRYFENENKSVDKIHYNVIKDQGITLSKDQQTMWKFYWKFRPQYPENWMQFTNQDLHFNEINMHESNTLVLNYPGRKQAGDYICLLEGPASIAQVTSHLEFAFPPELASPGITSVTATAGSHTVIELHIWSYPVPTSIYNENDGKIKDLVDKNCDHHQISSQIVQKYKTQKKGYRWYKVTTERTESKVKIIQKEPIHENWEPHAWVKQFSYGINQRQLVGTDAILINLPYYDTDIQMQQNETENKRSVLRKIPTIVYRLFLSPIMEKDYGEYMCELEYAEGRKQFFMQVQPPGDSAVSVNNIRFIRDDSRIQVYFDPLYFIKTGNPDVSFTNNNKNHIIMTKSTADLDKGDILHSLASKIDENQRLQWKMLVRICASDYYQRDQSSEHVIKDCASSQTAQAIQRKPKYHPWFHSYKSLLGDKYETTSLSSECVDKLVENPENGRIEIPLIYSHNYTLHNASILKGESEFNRTTEMKDFIIDYTTANALHVHWSKKEKLTYQFRFYDETGSLVYATNWFSEENDGYSDEPTQFLFNSHKTYLWITIIGLIIFLTLAILLIFALRKRIKHKKDLHSSNNNSSTPLNKSIISSAATSPVANCKLPENFYVANYSVVDSPCSLMNRNEKFANKQFPLLCSQDIQKLPNECYQSVNKHVNDQIPIRKYSYHKGEITEESVSPTNMPKNLYELHYNQLGLSHNQYSSEGLNEEVNSLSPVTRSPIVSHLTPIPFIRSNEVTPSTPLLFYNSCCHNRKFSVEMNHSLPPLFGPVPIQCNSQSQNSVSELSSPLLGNSNFFRKPYRTPANICYYQHLQNSTTAGSPRNNNYTKRNHREDSFDKIMNECKAIQHKPNNISDNKQDITNTLNCCNPTMEMKLMQQTNKGYTLGIDSFGRYNATNKHTYRPTLLKNNLYPLNPTECQSCQITTDSINNCNNTDCSNIFNSDNDCHNNLHFINNNNDNNLNKHKMTNLDLNGTSHRMHHSESEKLSSPLFENRQNSCLSKENHSNGIEENLLMDIISTPSVLHTPKQYHEGLCESNISTFSKNHNLMDRFSPYDNTTINTSTIKYNPISSKQMNTDSDEVYINESLLEENQFSLSITNDNNNSTQCTKITRFEDEYKSE
ncbi:Cell adhesion molecule [Schistosoma japonicum]|uniref:Cell adhesion molecule n=1 Tax=Schistosoma japonicum TaxID=6182 RepID=A0A4Z2DXM9_SCHJA|nr:Cell adhesion molecule [Schistosoma japonicum]